MDIKIVRLNVKCVIIIHHVLHPSGVRQRADRFQVIHWNKTGQ